jgi:hypothetical protein
MMLHRVRDAPASLVAWRCESLKYAGTVITASTNFLAEIVLGHLHLAQYFRRHLLGCHLLARTSTQASPLSARTIL